MKPGVKILSCASIVTSADTDDGSIPDEVLRKLKVNVAKKTIKNIQTSRVPEHMHWLIDCGASAHASGSKNILSNVRKVKEPSVIETLTNFVLIETEGDFHGKLPSGVPISLENVSYDASFKDS